ncbi:MAG: protein kinase [Candidatus Melainabacteria bacterium]|nr:protein kinase [Candidatus Melainabacteria bacterium]
MPGDELTFSSRYKLDAKLGSGGMGAVYRAYDCVLQKTVAVKLLLPSVSQNLAVRFQQEAKTAAKLDHPNIIKVLDFGQNDNSEFYLIMDYLEGKTLEQIVERDGPIELNAALRIFEQICLGMAHAHAHGVLHRDLKPSNIMINPELDHATIVDFGVAKLLSSDSMKLTGIGLPVGSPVYMSPEQAQGQEADARADLYSMGGVMYTTLIGRPPLMGATAMDTINLQIEQPAPLLNDEFFEGPKFPASLEELIQKALEKNPDERVQTFDELHSSLVAIRRELRPREPAKEPASSAESTPAEPKIKLKQSPVIAIGAVLALVLLVVTANIIAEFNHAKRPAKKKAVVAGDFSFKVSPGIDLHNPPWLVGKGNLHRNGIKSLYKYKKHTRLILMDPKLSDSDLAYVQTLPLVALHLSDTRVSAKRVSSLTTPELKCLILNGNKKIDDDSIVWLKKLDGLQVLGLRNTSVTDKGVDELSTMKSLRCLDLGDLKGVTPASILSLSKLPNLESLKIGGTAIGAKDAELLLKLPSLRYISFPVTDATDATFDTLMKLKPIIIDVSNTRITDRSLKKLLDIHFPVMIDVRGCKLLTKPQIGRLRNQFIIAGQPVSRIMSDSEAPGLIMTFSALPEQTVVDLLWYEPNTYRRKPLPGYSDFRKVIKDLEKQVDEQAKKYGEGNQLYQSKLKETAEDKEILNQQLDQESDWNLQETEE